MSSKKAAKKGKNGKCNEKEQNAYQKYHQNTLNDKEFNIPELSRAQIFIGKKFLNGKQSTNWRIDHKRYPTVALFVQGYIGIYGNVNLINFFKSYSIDSNDEFMLHGKSNWCNSVISVPDDKIIQYKTMVRKIYIYFRNNDASKKKDENIDVDNGIDSDVGVDSGEQKDNETDTDQFSASVAVMPTPQPKQISSRRRSQRNTPQTNELIFSDINGDVKWKDIESVSFNMNGTNTRFMKPNPQGNGTAQLWYDNSNNDKNVASITKTFGEKLDDKQHFKS